MVYLLYGSDVKKSREKLNEIIAEFEKKSSGLSVHKFDAEEEDPRVISSAADAASLFAQKKLIVLKYPSLAKNKVGLYEILERTKENPDVTVILWDRDIERKILGELRSYCSKSQEFVASREETKLPEKNIFGLGDTFFVSKKEGLRNLLHLLHQGHDDFNLFSYLSNHARTLLTVRHYLENKKLVPPKHGIHPFVVKKASALVRSLSTPRLHKLLHRFLEEDHKIKVGISKPRDSLLSLLWNRSRET